MDAKEAAKRLKRYNEAGTAPERLAVYESEADQSPMGVMRAIRRDSEAVLDAYLAATQPADDAEALTEEWLRDDEKFIEDWNREGDIVFSANGLHLCKWPDGWRWQIGGTENCWENFATPTRGAVRAIRRMLGVNL